MSPQSALVTGLQAAVKNVLALDPELAEGIAELDGAVLEVHVQGIDRRFQLHATTTGVTVVPVDDSLHSWVSAPDVTISGPPFTLLRLLGSLDSVDGVLPPDVSISGELQLVQRLTRLAKRANLDWEEPLSSLFGDSVAHELGRGIRGFATWARVAGRTIARDMGEYLREERRMSPVRFEVEEFSTRVDQIRDDVERLVVRIARLQSRVGRP